MTLTHRELAGIVFLRYDAILNSPGAPKDPGLVSLHLYTEPSGRDEGRVIIFLSLNFWDDACNSPTTLQSRSRFANGTRVLNVLLFYL